MAYEINYGDGEMGDLEIADGAVQNINSYARVVKIEQNTVTLDENIIEGKYNSFRAGTDILLHVSATNRGSADFLGIYTFAKITLIQNGIATLDKNISNIFTGVNLDYEYVQAVTIPNFDCVKLRDGAIVTCPPYNPYENIGGILIIRCWQDLLFDGGVIDLTDCGIPANRKNSLRPLTTQETATNGESDQAKFSGQENFITADRFLLNAGDGAVMILAKNIICDENSRIGNPKTHGAAHCRGHKSSVGVKPSNITNIGGSTILIAADEIKNFTPKIIAKYRSISAKEGRGLCRCYIATNSVLPTDEGLYALDILADKNRVRNLGIDNFGNGNFGDFVNPNMTLNNYAKVNAISQGGYRFSYSDKTFNGLAPLRKNSLVMILATQKNAVADAGKFVVARVLSDTGYSVITSNAFNVDLENYSAQIISIPEFSNLTINNNFKATPKFENGKGGVFAIAVNGTFNFSGGKINVEGKGGAVAYGRAGLNFIGNSQMHNRLPIGSGNGSIFILAKNLIMDENSRIGAAYSGGGTGGKFGGNNSNDKNAGGGYAGAEDEDGTGSGGGFIGGGSAGSGNVGGLGGSGASGGTSQNLREFDSTKISGGYGGNGAAYGRYAGGCQGAHIMLIANSIQNFSINAISTGGEGGKGIVNGKNGAASFGGGGSFGGSSGGSGGFAFIFVNS